MTSGTVVKFSGTLSKTDPISVPVLIVGQEKYLSKLTFAAVKCKLEPRVNEQVRISTLENTKKMFNFIVNTYLYFLDFQVCIVRIKSMPY